MKWIDGSEIDLTGCTGEALCERIALELWRSGGPEQWLQCPEPLQNACFLIAFDTELTMEGIFTFLENSLGHYASCIVHAFRMIGAQEDAGALEQICDIAPPDLMRGEFLENAWEEYALSTFNEDHELTEGAVELIEHLSGRLYLHTGRDIWSLLFQYLDRELGQAAP